MQPNLIGYDKSTAAGVKQRYEITNNLPLNRSEGLPTFCDIDKNAL